VDGFEKIYELLKIIVKILRIIKKILRVIKKLENIEIVKIVSVCCARPIPKLLFEAIKRPFTFTTNSLESNPRLYFLYL